MLRKLLKYDFRANMRIFVFVWPAILLFAVIERLTLTADLTGNLYAILVSTTTTLFVLAVIAAGVFSLVISIIRFYSGLLRNEGYLMFTLPVRAWQLIVSKLIVAFVTIAVTIVVGFLSVWFLFDGVRGFYDVLDSFFGRISAPDALSLVLGFVVCILALCMAILQIYLACSIGHLARRHRILWSVLTYYAINIVIEVIAVTGVLLAVPVLATVARNDIPGLLGVIAIAEAALCVLYFFFSERILRKRLNLE